LFAAYLHRDYAIRAESNSWWTAFVLRAAAVAPEVAADEDADEPDAR